MSQVTFVLVHGAFGNATQWGPLTRALIARGHRALALDLPGHGLDRRVEGMIGLGTADEVAVVSAAIRAVQGLGPVVLVGHSRGGLAVTATTNAIPELIDHAVYVSAWCCVVGGPASYATPQPSAFDALIPRLLLADPAEVGELRVNFPSADSAVLDALHQAAFADGTRDELLALLWSMDRAESVEVDTDSVRVDPARWGSVPHTYVRSSADHALLPAVQDRFIAEADHATPADPFVVHDLDTSHFGILLRPEPLAGLLVNLAVSAS